ncbi:lysylphosphatidylglycerol synthase transmembrane domain-containing protein [Nonomuraea fuscirosea]|uniref:lysylphosphatidylglycerol synthase transmembrane domain-containing protein n=1 Tax=Nonomuraea fuscirosea TaxID=1291556 RepID=UPI002DDB591A|nr:lysylphosphatidylglycerol synthase transmembrane domain-containing protein [Nonomuraea fuscirosea]WSA50276.1 flippase-like domain-containing protein [Nonomuraea fuscirosea]
MSTEEDVTVEPVPRRRPMGRRLVRYGFLAVALGFGAWAVGRQWDDVVAGFSRLTPAALAGSLVAVVAALLGAMLTWRTLLADLGSPLPARPAAKVFFVGQLGKYIPGTIWPVLAQMEMGRDLGVPRARSAAAFFLMMPIQLATGLLVTLVTLGWDRYGWLLLFIPLLLVLLEPKVINAVIGYALRRLKREPLERPLTRRGMLTALGWALTGWIAYGVHLYFVAPQGGLVFAVGAFALSWCLGILTFVIPAGAGVRELAMVTILAPHLDQGAAIAVALSSRIVIIVGDLICAGLAGIAARRDSV